MSTNKRAITIQSSFVCFFYDETGVNLFLSYLKYSHVFFSSCINLLCAIVLCPCLSISLSLSINPSIHLSINLSIYPYLIYFLSLYYYSECPLPLSLGTIMYWSAGLSPDLNGSRFLTFEVILFTFAVTCAQLFRLFACILPNIATAFPIAGVCIILMVLFSGTY